MWRRTHRGTAALAPIASGFLIDFDHFVDYALAKRGPGERWLILPLHGWEYLPLWILLDRLLGTRGGLTAGYVLHLGIDQLYNEKRTHRAYSVIWRARRGFRADNLGPVDPEQRHQWRKESPLGLLRWF